MRVLIWLHRYLGIAIGWLIAAWCLSGIVMIYVPYPSLTFDEHVEALPLLELGDCCRLDAGLAELPADDFSIEMHAGRSVLTVGGSYGEPARIALDTGTFVDGMDRAAAIAAAEDRTAHWTGREPVRYLGEIEVDQWTVGYYRPGRRLHHLALGDTAGTEWYFDGDSGELVQATTARERSWNYVGSVLHWLYFTPLRQLGPIWANVVIYSTLVALVLTAIGIWLGIARARFGRGIRLSPFRGLARWHHLLGLGFAAVTLTWLFSGLLSMNPWGWLIGSGPRGEVARLEGEAPSLNAVVGDIAAMLAQRALPAGTTYVESAPFGGRLYLLAHTRDGGVHRLDGATLAPAPLAESALVAAAPVLRPELGVVEAGLIDTPDAYYYDRRSRGTWPVFRVIFDDAARTRYYIDPRTGKILNRIDATSGAYRWLFTALHSLDFAAIIRVRPLWDLLMITLLLGVTAVSISGSWLGLRYLLRRIAQRRPAEVTATASGHD